MPKIRNFSDREKRQAMDPLHIHRDINAVHLRTGTPYPSPLARKAAPPINRNFVRNRVSLVRQTDNAE